MIVVIQCAARKQRHAGHFRTADCRPVMFVANPKEAPCGDGLVYARPDDPSCENGKSWRDALCDYNKKYKENPSENPYGLLPAWQLYRHPTYKRLADRYGPDRLYILSAGWGLIAASFLTPMYDITFSKAEKVGSCKRRSHRDKYQDLRMLPSDVAGPVAFFGGKDYIPLFCDLTKGTRCQRTVFYAGKKPCAPGCITRCCFRKPFIMCHYQCAKKLIDGRIRLEDA